MLYEISIFPKIDIISSTPDVDIAWHNRNLFSVDNAAFQTLLIDLYPSFSIGGKSKVEKALLSSYSADTTVLPQVPRLSAGVALQTLKQG